MGSGLKYLNILSPGRMKVKIYGIKNPFLDYGRG